MHPKQPLSSVGNNGAKSESSNEGFGPGCKVRKRLAVFASFVPWFLRNDKSTAVTCYQLQQYLVRIAWYQKDAGRHVKRGKTWAVNDVRPGVPH